ncbi:MAG: hypothetical protein IT204_23530 [Fimbriimonadaceae bacterium]|nr:hypothetical protein [Fimbriimonadaceae bacterium]
MYAEAQAEFDFVRRLLEMVTVLHDRGYQGLRAFPYLGGAGFLRLQLQAPGRREDLYYSCAAGYEAYDLVATPDHTVGQLATALEAVQARFLAACRLADPAYAAWHAAALEVAGPQGIYLMLDGNRMPEPAGPFYWRPADDCQWDGRLEYLPPQPPRPRRRAQS